MKRREKCSAGGRKGRKGARRGAGKGCSEINAGELYHRMLFMSWIYRISFKEELHSVFGRVLIRISRV